jgi:hypothetical protein
MFDEQKTSRIREFFGKNLSFFDLEGKRKYEFSKDLVEFSTNRVITTPKKLILSYLLMGLVIFLIVFYALLYFLKPVKELESLKITRENLIAIDDKPSKSDIKFKTSIPVAVKWNNEYFFFEKKNKDGQFDIDLPKKEGVHKFYFYAYTPGMFEKSISSKPVLITKEFDFTKPSLSNLQISDKFTEKNSTWSFETDEAAALIKLKVGAKELVVYNPNASYNENPCKQEKVNSNIKYTCPVTFEKEETIQISAVMSDKVDNTTQIVENKTIAYVEPLKVDCNQPPSKTRFDNISIKCKSNRTTTFTINKNGNDTIEKDKEKIVNFNLEPGQPSDKEYDFTLSFVDPNGGTKDLSYKFTKDNLPPSLEFNPTILKTGNLFTLNNEIKNSQEKAKVEVNFDQAASPNSTWYYKYPGGNTFDVESNSNTSITNYSTEFRLCTKDPITNSETCANSYIPGLIYYNYKVSDEIGNTAQYLCTYELSLAPTAKCAKF